MTAPLFRALPAALLLGSLAVGEEHYTRAPFQLATSVQDFQVASDGEVSVIAYLEGPSTGRIRASLTDGRGLAANWSLPVRISDDTNVLRSLDDSSCQTFGTQAFVAWLDDRDGAAATRVHLNRFDDTTDTWFAAPVEVDDTGLPVGSDIEEFHLVAKRGTSGATYVYVMTRVAAGGLDHLFINVSFDGGATFNPPQRVNQSGTSPGQIGGISCDSRFGELHVAWTDDRNGTMDLFYRLGLLSFGGNVIWFQGDTLLSTTAGSEALGSPLIDVNGEFGWTGFDAKYVGVAYLQDDGDGTSNLHVASSADNGVIWSDALLAQTAGTAVDVQDFDFDIPGDTFVVVWQDDSSGEPQVYRAESSNGAAFVDVSQMSAQETFTNTGRDVALSSSFGLPDGSVVAFIEDTPLGPEIFTAFGDQAFGGEWHDEYIAVSSAQSDSPGVDVRSPRAALNALYYNFILGWMQESAPASGSFDLWIGGYRPQQVELEGWFPGSASIQWHVEHTPFQDTFGFVLASLAPPTDGPGAVLYDGRKTGFVFDGVTASLLNQPQFLIFRNDSATEGGSTQPKPIPPFVSAPALTYLAVTWGPFGDLHVLTEPFRTEFELP